MLVELSSKPQWIDASAPFHLEYSVSGFNFYTFRRDMESQTGTLKFYNRVKGYGFIRPDAGGQDIFVHYSEFRRADIYSFDDGMRLVFETRPDKRGAREQAVNLKRSVDTALGELPEQGVGPHFRIDKDALLIFDVPPPLDPSGNNIARLRSLQPLLVDLCQQLLANLSVNEQPQLRVIAADYLMLAARPVEEIDYVRLYGLGLRFANSITAAKRKISARMLPPLEDGAVEALDSLLALHGPFVLSTKAGNELLADAERYEMQSENELAAQEAALMLANELELDRAISAPEVGRFIREAVGDVKVDGDDRKIAAYSAGAMKNITVVLIAGASLAAIPIAGGIFLGPPGLIGGAIISLLGNEGLKKSRSFDFIQSKITNIVDEFSSIDLIDLARKLIPLKNFVLRNEPVLRRLAGNNLGLKWVHRYLDWIKAQSA